MERICSQCHAQLGLDYEGDWCPACGGSLLERPAGGLGETEPAEVDHRGVVLPRRHAVGGVITPQ